MSCPTPSWSRNTRREAFFAPLPKTAAAARGHWILYSCASDHFVGKTNLTKRELKELTHGGP
eukprot:9965685-Heterocapsa_arctica.AAC.1